MDCGNPGFEGKNRPKKAVLEHKYQGILPKTDGILADFQNNWRNFSPKGQNNCSYWPPGGAISGEILPIRGEIGLQRPLLRQFWVESPEKFRPPAIHPPPPPDARNTPRAGQSGQTRQKRKPRLRRRTYNPARRPSAPGGNRRHALRQPPAIRSHHPRRPPAEAGRALPQNDAAGPKPGPPSPVPKPGKPGRNAPPAPSPAGPTTATSSRRTAGTTPNGRRRGCGP